MILIHISKDREPRELTKSCHDLEHPVDTFSAWCTLAAGFMLVKFNKTCNGLHNVCLLIHDNDSSCTKRSLTGHQSIKIHDSFFTHAGKKREQ